MSRAGGIAIKTLKITTGFIVSLPIVSSCCRVIVRVFSIPEHVTQRVPIEKKFPFSVGGKELVYESSMYDAVGRVLYWQGFENYERESMLVFEKLIRNAKTFVDVGANTGIFTLAGRAFNKDLSIHAFEPVPDIFEKLEKILALNNMHQDVHASMVAISNTRAWTGFHVPEDNMSSGSLNLDGAQHLHGQVVSVQCTTLDTYAEENKISKIDFIKIDVEGFEDQVLEGARRILERDHPAIICECLPDCNTATMEALLKSLGYSLFLLTDRGPLKKSHIEPDKEMIFKNYLFVANDREIEGC